jgi:hypothetical protein
VTRAKRIGELLSNQFALLKAFAKLSISHADIGGLKLEQPTCHGTAPSYNDERCDKVEAYFTLDTLMKFNDADVTSQQLLDQNIILVSQDRVQVDLRDQ